MKKLFKTAALSISFVVFSAVATHAAIIPGLFATGVDNAGNSLGDGVADSHYSILAPSQSAIVINQASIPGSWFANGPNHRWVWETNTGQPTNVTRTFRTTFNLAGLVPSTASISGSWATDNAGLDILVNGNSTGNTCGGFSLTCGFSVSNGFVSGLNTLDFIVQDFGVISGFLVSSIRGTADAQNGTPIPEPATLAVFGLGLAGLGIAAHRRKTH